MDNLTLERLQRLHGAACGMPFGIFSELFDGSEAREAFGSPGDGDSDSLDDDLWAPFKHSDGWVYGFEPDARLGHSSNRACADGHLNTPYFEHASGHADRKAEGLNKWKGPASFGYRAERTSGTDSRLADDQMWASRYGACADVLSASSSLNDLDNIYIAEMKMRQKHHGRVLYGTISNPPDVVDGLLRMCVKDQSGNKVDAVMHFSPGEAMDIKKTYNMGKHVAIKHPCLWEGADGLNSCIVVWNARDSIEVVGKLPRMTPTTLLHDAQMHVVEENWDLALQRLMRCIEMVNSETSGFHKSDAKESELRSILVDCFSTQAKVFCNTYCFEAALNACNEALKIDRYHCKSLYRKALALEGIFCFGEACACLEEAANRNRGCGKTKRKKKIRAILRSCKNCCSVNQRGKYADLARYLLHSYNPDKSGFELPSFVNYVGHVQVKLHPKGKTRGLFASRNIKAGDILMVSNAMAICYQSEGVGKNVSAYESEVEKLICMVKSKENLQHVLSYLKGSDSTNTLCTSELGALGESLPTDVDSDETLHLRKDCIREIIRLNAFAPHQFCRLLARHEYASKYVDARGYLGLWFLPSLINHWCLPNASRLVVGEAMFVHAASDVNQGEEVTLPYVDTLMPLVQRRRALERWGFCCACKRCTFEQTMQAPLSKVIKGFDSWYNWIVETVEKAVAAQALRGFGDQSFSFPERTDFETIVSELGSVMTSTRYGSMDDEKSTWMMASFSAFLWFKSLPLLSGDFSDPGIVGLFGSLLDAMQRTVPGHIRSLVLVGNINGILRQGALEGPAFGVCKSVFGAQEPHVLAELVRLYGSVVPFP